MARPRFEVGMTVTAKPPLSLVQRDLAAARELGRDAVFVWDHLQDFYPAANAARSDRRHRLGGAKGRAGSGSGSPEAAAGGRPRGGRLTGAPTGAG
jgi:hypothetical protein